MDNVDDIEIRKTYEINQLFQSEDPKLIDIAIKVKEAYELAIANCQVKDSPDFSIYAEIEKKSIEIEEKNFKEKKKFLSRIQKGLVLSCPNGINVSNTNIYDVLPDYALREMNEIQKQKEINKFIQDNI